MVVPSESQPTRGGGVSVNSSNQKSYFPVDIFVPGGRDGARQVFTDRECFDRPSVSCRVRSLPFFIVCRAPGVGGCRYPWRRCPDLPALPSRFPFPPPWRGAVAESRSPNRGREQSFGSLLVGWFAHRRCWRSGGVARCHPRRQFRPRKCGGPDSFKYGCVFEEQRKPTSKKYDPIRSSTCVS